MTPVDPAQSRATGLTWPEGRSERRIMAAALAYSMSMAKRGERQLVRYNDIEAALRAADFETHFVDPSMS